MDRQPGEQPRERLLGAEVRISSGLAWSLRALAGRAAGATLRDETDLDSLGDDPVAVLEEPVPVSVWLRAPSRLRRESR